MHTHTKYPDTASITIPAATPLRCRRLLVSQTIWAAAATASFREMSEFRRFVAAVAAVACFASISCWMSIAGIITSSGAQFEDVEIAQFIQASPTSLTRVAHSSGFATFTQLQDTRAGQFAFHQYNPVACVSALQSSVGMWTWVRCDCQECRASAIAQLLPSVSSPQLTTASSCGQPLQWSTVSTNHSAVGLQSAVFGLPAAHNFVSARPLPRQMSLSASTFGLFLLNCPVLSCLVVAMLAIFLLLWRGVWSVQLAVADASSLLHRGEVWRVFSAALSHHSPIHFAMNILSLCNLAFIEPLLGSYTFAMLTVCFIVLVELLDAVWRAALSNREGHQAQWSRPHLGFSGVLFAWMMFATAQLDTFCPIPFLPLCVPTVAVGSFRVNLGPLLLVAAIQLLVPISSFIGHCAGVLAGIMLLLMGSSMWSLSLVLAGALIALAAVSLKSAKAFTALQLQGRFASTSSIMQVNEQRQEYMTSLFVLEEVAVNPVGGALLTAALSCCWAAATAFKLLLGLDIATLSTMVGSSTFMVICLYGQASNGTQAVNSSSEEESQGLISSVRRRGRVGPLEIAEIRIGPFTWKMLQGHLQSCLVLWVALGAACLLEELCSASFSLLVFGQLVLQITQPHTACNSMLYQAGLVWVAQLVSASVHLVLFQRTVLASSGCRVTLSRLSIGLAQLNLAASSRVNGQ